MTASNQVRGFELRLAQLEAEIESASGRGLREERIKLLHRAETLRRERDILARELRHERARTVTEVRRIANSRSWRYGHALMRLARALSGRRSRGKAGAPEEFADLVESRLREEPEIAESWGPVCEPIVSTAQLTRLAQRLAPTVVVPIHNAVQDLKRCLDSLLRNTPGDAEILLIDDASSDPAIRWALRDVEKAANVTVIHNPHSVGFAAAANLGIDHASGDVVLLNSDTEVPPRWLEGLAFVAYSEDRVATVTPLSNNAGPFSAPRAGRSNSPPDGVSADQLGRVVRRTSERIAPAAPSGSGFCLYVRRAAIDEIGRFDAIAFPRGYGEDGDFCMRASRAGWQHRVDDATFVLHARTASFGRARRGLARSGRRVIQRRYPEYRDLAADFLHSRAMEDARRNIAHAYSAATRERVTPRTLLAVGTTGRPQLTDTELRAELAERGAALGLVADAETLTLLALEDGTLAEVDCALLPSSASGDGIRDRRRERLASLLIGWDVELVHVAKPTGDWLDSTLDLSAVARTLDITVTRA